MNLNLLNSESTYATRSKPEVLLAGFKSDTRLWAVRADIDDVYSISERNFYFDIEEQEGKGAK
jgi:hypothetical protein